MQIQMSTDSIDTVVQGLIGACDVAGGPTDEQYIVIQALVSHLWHQPELDVRSVSGLGPNELAVALVNPIDRQRFHEFLVCIEACRHPLTKAQVARVEQYEMALGINGPDMALFRSMVDAGAARAKADFARFLSASIPDRSEPSLQQMVVDAEQPEPELVARLEQLADCASGTLGHAYIKFYERSQLTLPGVEASGLNHFYVAHDMTHVIAGIDTTAQAEIALSAFQMAMNDDSINRSALLASLIVHEAGFGDSNKVRAEQQILARPGAADLLATEMDRGRRCSADFSRIDHLGIADVPLTEVREQFGVLRPADPNDGQHIFWEPLGS